MVAPLKLDNFVSPGRAAREADGAHSCFGTRACHSNLLKTGYQVAKTLGEFNFDFGRAAEAQAVLRCLNDGIANLRMVMAHDHRTPRKHIVDVLIAIGIEDIGAVGSLHESWCSANRFEGSDWRIDAARNASLCALK